MVYCPHCGSNLLQREQDGDISCLLCGRILVTKLQGLPHAKAAELRRPQQAARRAGVA